MNKSASDELLLRVPLAGGRSASIMVTGPAPTRATVDKIIAHLELMKDQFSIIDRAAETPADGFEDLSGSEHACEEGDHGHGQDRFQCTKCMIIMCPACRGPHRKGCL